MLLFLAMWIINFLATEEKIIPYILVHFRNESVSLDCLSVHQSACPSLCLSEHCIIYLLLLNERFWCIYIYIYLYILSILITALRILMIQTLLTNFEDEKAIGQVWTLTKFILIDLFLIKVIIDRWKCK